MSQQDPFPPAASPSPTHHHHRHHHHHHHAATTTTAPASTTPAAAIANTTSPTPSRPHHPAPASATAAAAGAGASASAGPLHPDSTGQDTTANANTYTSSGSNHARSHSSGPAQPQHKRVYQACIPCRRRKVRCDLGSVDNPHDPPCMRCRRESKECYFSATRRKRKNDDDADEYQDEYIIRNGRKRHYLDATPPVATEDERKPFNPVPLTPGGGAGRNQPLRRTDILHDLHHVAADGPRRASYAESIEDSNAQLENLEAQNVMRKGMYGPHDALDLLYKAATDKYAHLPSFVCPLFFSLPSVAARSPS